jgi:prepilin-type processing-associated H-X9-DG protein
MKRNPAALRQMRAFSLLELLVVIGIIAMLISLLLPALHGAREQAKMIVCRNNLRTIGQAATNYVATNKGAYPAGPLVAGTNMLTNVSEFTTSELMRAGVAREQFFCPFWREHEPEPIDRLWNSDVYALYFHVTGYCFFFGRTRQELVLMTPPKLWKFRASEPTRNPDDTELASDVTLSYFQSWPTRRFYDLSYTFSYGYDKGKEFNLTTAHLRDLQPQGGNVLFMDGHVEWRSFSDMQNRTPDTPFMHWF